jgi:hypothetical protein
MKGQTIQRFKQISELQKLLDEQIKSLKEENENMSRTIGEKLRVTDSNNSTELQEFREKIESSEGDTKKKKQVKKKDQKSNWYNLDAISVYDEIGLKGELELYFKTLEESKSELDRMTKIKQSIDELANKGLKKELGCIMRMNNQLPAEIVFTQTPATRDKFSFKAIFNVPSEIIHEIKN